MSLISIRLIKIVLLGLFVYLTTSTVNLIFNSVNSPDWIAMLIVIIFSTLLLLLCLETIPEFIQIRFPKVKYYGKNEQSVTDFDSFVKKSIDEMLSLIHI